MDRRGFVGCVIGTLTGIVGTKKIEGEKQLYKRCFRRNSQDPYTICEEIQWEDQKPGDEVFWFGFDNNRLYLDFVRINKTQDVKGERIVHVDYIRDMVKDAVEVFNKSCLVKIN